MDGSLNDGDRLKSEENLAMAEAELDKQTGLLTELTRKVDELQGEYVFLYCPNSLTAVSTRR